MATPNNDPENWRFEAPDRVERPLPPGGDLSDNDNDNDWWLASQRNRARAQSSDLEGRLAPSGDSPQEDIPFLSFENIIAGRQSREASQSALETKVDKESERVGPWGDTVRFLAGRAYVLGAGTYDISRAAIRKIRKKEKTDSEALAWTDRQVAKLNAVYNEGGWTYRGINAAVLYALMHGIGNIATLVAGYITGEDYRPLAESINTGLEVVAPIAASIYLLEKNKLEGKTRTLVYLGVGVATGLEATRGLLDAAPVGLMYQQAMWYFNQVCNGSVGAAYGIGAASGAILTRGKLLTRKLGQTAKDIVGVVWQRGKETVLSLVNETNNPAKDSAKLVYDEVKYHNKPTFTLNLLQEEQQRGE